MNVDVNIDAAEVNKMVAEAILNSSIGVQLKAAIQEQVSKLTSSYYENPYKSVISRIIEQEVRTLIETEYKSLIQEQVKQRMTEAFTQDLLNKLWEAFIKRADY